MASPAASSSITTTTNSNNTFQSSRKQIDDLYARHRRASNESLSNDRIDQDSRNTMSKSNQSIGSQNTFARSQSIESERSKLSSFRRFNSADEADEEVSRIHRQGELLRRQHEQTAPSTSRASNNLPQQQQQQGNVQYEVVDEDGNPLAINGVQDLIKMSGVRAREVPQPDGTVIKEYVIDDPQLLSQVHSQQQQQQSPIDSQYGYQQQQRAFDPDAPTLPPRIPLRPPILFRPDGSTNNAKSSSHIQQIQVIESQRHYEYLTMNGRRVQFSILNSKDFDRQSITDKDIRELSHAINIRLVPYSTSTMNRQQNSSSSPVHVPYHPPKPWHPVVDVPPRQRLGSDSQSYSNNRRDIGGFQQIQGELSRSVSSGALNQQPFYPQNQTQQQDWNHYRNWNGHQQQRPQSSEPFQSSAQFLPQQQTTRSTYSSPPPSINHHYYQQQQQQPANYPYQGQQQHGVQLYTDYNQQQTAMVNNGNTRI